MERAAMEAAVRGYFRAVEAGDGAALRALFADDVRWRVPQGAIEPYAGLHEGAETVIEMMLGAVAASFEAGSQHSEIRHLLCSDSLAVAEVEMRARTPEGADYRNAYAFFFEFGGGRIQEIREHVDTRYAADFFASGG